MLLVSVMVVGLIVDTCAGTGKQALVIGVFYDSH